VREFCQLAFHFAGIDLRFEGTGQDEKGIDSATGRTLVEVSANFYRPTMLSICWAIRPKRKTNWDGTSKDKFEELVRLMVLNDMSYVQMKITPTHIDLQRALDLAEDAK
jgi:GDPmannose 4,6-dehydratase